VEANWTSPALAPLVVLAHQSLAGKPAWRKWLFRLLPVTIVLVLFMRIVMIMDVLPVSVLEKRYHSWKEWPGVMHKATGGHPVVFRNSYQRASKYWFYSGQTTHSVNLYKERMNNFDFWPLADSLLAKPVYVLDTYDMWMFEDSIHTPIGWVGYRYDSAFVSFAPVKIMAALVSGTVKPEDPVRLRCNFTVPPLYRDFIKSHPDPQDTVRIGIFGKKGWIEDVITPISLEEMVSGKPRDLEFEHGLPPGKYDLRFAINRGYRIPTHNSDRIPLRIE
jgi:hypothetical protein